MAVQNDQQEMKQKIWCMDKEEYINFMKEVHMSYPGRSQELTNRITNAWKSADKKEVKKEAAGKTAATRASNAVDVVSGSCSGQGSKPVSSQLSQPLGWQISAWKTGFIFRGDKVPDNGRLYIDVEKVSLRKESPTSPHKQVAATVSVVNEDGKVVLWALIKYPDHEVCQYSSKITNLSQNKLSIGVDISMVQCCLTMLKRNTLVGAAVGNDAKSLNVTFACLDDLQDTFKDDNGPFSLRMLAQLLLHNRSGFQAGHHSAIDDARMTLAIDRKKTEILKDNKMESTIQYLSSKRKEFRDSKPKYVSEKCSCKF